MKVVVLGDSISEGIGSKKVNYIPFCEEILGEEYFFINMAKTGSTINYPCDHLSEIINEKPDICVIMYGNVDAQIRANKFKIEHRLPRRYRGGGMLDPRAFYSSKWYKRIMHYIDNAVRFVLKKWVIFRQGTIQFVDIDTFGERYEYLITNLLNNESIPLLVSTVYLDDSYFLGSSHEYEKYNQSIKNLSVKYCCQYVDLFEDQKNCVKIEGWNSLYSHDHFHPNQNGYEFIAKKISNAIKEMTSCSEK